MRVRRIPDRHRRNGFHCTAGYLKVCQAIGNSRHNAVGIHRCDCRVQCPEGYLACTARDGQIGHQVKPCTGIQFPDSAVEQRGDRVGRRVGNQNVLAFKCRHFDAVVGQNALFTDHLYGCTDFYRVIGGKAEFCRHVLSDSHIVLSRLLLVSESGECRIECFHIAVKRITAEQDGNKAFRVIHQHGAVKGKVNVRAHRTCPDCFQHRGRGGDHAHVDIQMRRRNIQLDALDRVVAVLFKDDLPLAYENIPAVLSVRARDIRVRAFSVRLGIPLDPLAACRVQVVDRCGHIFQTIILRTLENIARWVDIIVRIE